MRFAKKYLLVPFLVAATVQARADLLNDIGGLVSNEEQNNVETKSKLDKYWEVLPINLNLRINNTVDLSDHAEIGPGLSYDLRVEPSFVNNYHQRYDIYSFKPKLETKETKFKAGFQGGVSITYSRPYNSKKEAVFTKPPVINIFNKKEWATKFPWSSELARNKDVLATNAAARLEFSSDGHLGIGTDEVRQQFKLGVGASFSKGARLLVDIYKLQSSKIRMRLLTNRTLGNLNFGVEASLDKKLSGGISLLNRAINRWFKCSPIQLDTSTNLTQDTPIETYMIDYVLDLAPNADGSQSEGSKAYDSIMANISNVFTFMNMAKELNIIYEDGKMTERLLGYVDYAEKAFRKSRDTQTEDRSINRLFKGRTESRFTTIALGSDCFHIWDTNTSQTFSETNVRSYDDYEKTSEYIYISTLMNTKKEFLKWAPKSNMDVFGNSVQITGVNKQSNYSMNAIFDANPRIPNSLRLDPVSEGLSDIVINSELTDVEYSKKEIADLKRILNYHLAPVFAQQPIEWDSFQGDRTNAYARTTYEFHADALSQLRGMNNMTPAVLQDALAAYIKKYPNKAWLTPYAITTNEYFHMKDQVITQDDKLFLDIMEITKHLYVALTNEDSDRRIQAFMDLRRNPIFLEIGPGFLINFLSKSQEVSLQDLVTVRISMGSTEGVVPQYHYGNRAVSKTYKSVEYIMNVIGDRSFDLRLQLDGANGNVFKLNKVSADKSNLGM